MISGVLTLFTTFFDIIRLRKGPDAIPYYPPLLLLVAMAWLAVSAIAHAVRVDTGQGGNFSIMMLLSGVALVLYALVFVFTGKGARMVQAFTAILGCATVLQSVVFVLDMALLPLSGKEFPALLSFLIMIWSVMVDGHIIGRTINRHWYIGLLIAVTVFLIQVELSLMFYPADAAAS